MPIVFIQVADHYTPGCRCMHKVIIGQVYADMRYPMPAVHMEKYKVALFSILYMFYALTVAILLHCGAQKVYAINLAI